MLPKISYPIYDAEIPSTKLKIKYRPMLVKDEKILLTAKESGVPNDIFKAIQQIVNNCIVNADFDVHTLTLFDMEFLFIKIRAVSVGNVVSITYRDDEDDKDYSFNVDLEKIDVKFPDNQELYIKFDDESSGLKLKYPVADIYQSPVFENPDASPTDLFDELVVHCLDQYFEGDKVVQFKDVPAAQIREFIDNLDVKTFQKVRDFINNLPTVYHEITYGKDKSLKLTSLTDFFSF